MAMNSVIHEITYAPTVYRLLNGCICLYKPSKKSFTKTRQALLQKTVHELNSMECRPPRQRVEITGDLVTGNENCLNVEVKPNLADHVLVSGQRYDEKHIALSLENNPGWFSSGIIIGFIGSHAFKAKQLHKNNFRKTYEIKGKLGLASRNYREDGKIIAKATYKHIRKDHFHRILSKIEAAQRSLMFKMSGLDLRSEKAYEMAVSGFVPPANKKTMPIIYAIQPLSFDLPDFSFRVQCMNENEPFLTELVNEIGIELKSFALCTGIRLTNYGPFTIENALLQKHWTLDHLLENIHYCNRLLQKYEEQAKQ